MESLTKGQTVWIHSYTVGHGNNIKLKQSVHTDKKRSWKRGACWVVGLMRL